MKVCRNTFQAFTRKFDKPIESEFKGGPESLGGWIELLSLNHERRAMCGCVMSLELSMGEKYLALLENFPQTILCFTDIQKGWGFKKLLLWKQSVLFLWFLLCYKTNMIVFSVQRARMTPLYLHCSFCLWWAPVTRVTHTETNLRWIPLRSVANWYCLPVALAPWPLFCETFQLRLESF